MIKAIVYASTTGNTQIMAEAIADGARSTGSNVLLVTVDSASVSDVLAADVIILGSPAMGAEALDDSMESFFSSIENQISGKKIALFGSYDWGDGEWLRTWSSRVLAAHGELINENGLAGHLVPDEQTCALCRLLGETV